VRTAQALAAVAGALLLIATPAVAAAPQVGGRAYYVQNAATGEVLLQRHARQRVPIASITKLMTVLVALEHARLGEVVRVTKGAAAVGESSIYLRPGDRLTVRELVEAALIQSANDAAVALADYTSHGRRNLFVAWMNAKARALGLRDTHFVNPDGFDARGHYSSARDVTRLAQIAMRNPVVRATVRRTDASISGGRQLHTWNDLLYSFPGLIGVKTGHTSAAGWSEAAAAAGSQGVTIYATLLGERTRLQRNVDLTRLLTYGLSRYRIVRVVQPRRVYATAAVPYGKTPLGLVAARPATHTVRVDRTLHERVVSARVVSLPVVKGEQLGEVRVYSRGEVIARMPLVASRSISRPGVLGRVRWYAGQTAHHVWSWVS
jgi:serine-type D-Ala-D-Ala carboxypeptidase (penicillin-binding protein 5/6)